MASNALIQTLIDAGIKGCAAAVLDSVGITVGDAVHVQLARADKEEALPCAFATAPVVYDAWFRAKVHKALDDPCPAIPDTDVEAHFAKRRKAASRKAERNKARQMCAFDPDADPEPRKEP